MVAGSPNVEDLACQQGETPKDAQHYSFLPLTAMRRSVAYSYKALRVTARVNEHLLVDEIWPRVFAAAKHSRVVGYCQQIVGQAPCHCGDAKCNVSGTRTGKESGFRLERITTSVNVKWDKVTNLDAITSLSSYVRRQRLLAADTHMRTWNRKPWRDTALLGSVRD